MGDTRMKRLMAAAVIAVRPGPGSMARGCKAQFETSFYRVVTRIHHRCVMQADAGRGGVLTFAVFDHAGTTCGRLRRIQGIDCPGARLICPRYEPPCRGCPTDAKRHMSARDRSMEPWQ